jgi:galactokinase
MERKELIIEKLQTGAMDERFRAIYVEDSQVSIQRKRYEAGLERFCQLFGNQPVEIYSAPGRTEVCGNHTDHQHGHVLAASVNLDAIAFVSKRADMVVRLVSGDYPEITVDFNHLKMQDKELGTTAALIRGVAAALAQEGFHIGGFDAYVTSDVLMGAGMSSSAAFESLIGTIVSGLYNDMGISPVTIAKAGQYAENVYFGKPCGLMDQMACSVGGLIYIDFKDEKNPVVEQVPCDFKKENYSLCITDTLGSHADLTDDYAAIPAHMKQVAKLFGKEYLREVEPEEFYQQIAMVRKQAGDRSTLRAMHFFGEMERVANGVCALKNQDFNTFLQMIAQSGDSSAKLLQNIYSSHDVEHQNVMIALAASVHILGENGVSRVHGGGFAGTIQAFVKHEAVPAYKEFLESIFGTGSCHVLNIRPYGGIRVL